MHHVGVVLAGENVAGAAHIGGELIDFVKPPIDHLSDKVRITKITDHEIIGLGFAEARKFEIAPRTQKPSRLSRLTR